MDRRQSPARRGLTLIELVVVVAILAVLTMIIIPKLDGLQGNANHAVGAASASDTARYIQTYRTTKQRFPDGWDSLMNGSALWGAANPGTTPVTRGLHTKLSGATPMLLATDPTGPEVTALNSAGISTLYNVNASAASSVRPGDMFTDPAVLSTSTKVATLDPTSSNGRKVIDHIYRQNLQTGGTSGAIPSGVRLFVFGFGPQNKLIGSLMLEAPLYPNVDQTLVYGRNLVVFEVGSKVAIKAVLGADGDLLDDLTTYLNRDM